MEPFTPDQPLCQLGDIKDGGATAVDAVLSGKDADATSVILLRRGKAVQAYINICPHAGRRLDYAPGQFLLKDRTLICAVHGASFQQDDGLCIGGPCRGEHLSRVPVRVDDDGVFLAAPFE